MIAVVRQIIGKAGKDKLTIDIAWSMGSFIILALSGIIINIAITFFRDASALGVFNLAYAVYIVISQFAAWGIHYSVLRYSAYYKNSITERSVMLMTALVVTFVLGGFFSISTMLAEPLFYKIFGSESAALAIQNAAYGLIIFPINKVLLAYLNGLREMKAFSIIQGIRYASVMVVVAVISSMHVGVEYITFAFIVAEVITAFCALSYILIRKQLQISSISSFWFKKHILFGSKGLFGGMFAEINSRVDVILIGFFLGDRETGIYSFAAMLADGLYHVIALVRINFNPVLVSSIKNKKWNEAKNLRSKSAKYVFPIVLFLSVGILSVYYALASFILPEKGIIEGFIPLLILLSGINFICILVPFDNLMVVSGHPGYQACQQIITVSINTVAAVVLIPLLNISGAAIGTAMGYASGIIALTIFSKEKNRVGSNS